MKWGGRLRGAQGEMGQSNLGTGQFRQLVPLGMSEPGLSVGLRKRPVGWEWGARGKGMFTEQMNV